MGVIRQTALPVQLAAKLLGSPTVRSFYADGAPKRAELNTGRPSNGHASTVENCRAGRKYLDNFNNYKSACNGAGKEGVFSGRDIQLNSKSDDTIGSALTIRNEDSSRLAETVLNAGFTVQNAQMPQVLTTADSSSMSSSGFSTNTSDILSYASARVGHAGVGVSHILPSSTNRQTQTATQRRDRFTNVQPPQPNEITDGIINHQYHSETDTSEITDGIIGHQSETREDGTQPNEAAPSEASEAPETEGIKKETPKEKEIRECLESVIEYIGNNIDPQVLDTFTKEVGEAKKINDGEKEVKNIGCIMHNAHLHTLIPCLKAFGILPGEDMTLNELQLMLRALSGERSAISNFMGTCVARILESGSHDTMEKNLKAMEEYYGILPRNESEKDTALKVVILKKLKEKCLSSTGILNKTNDEIEELLQKILADEYPEQTLDFDVKILAAMAQLSISSKLKVKIEKSRTAMTGNTSKPMASISIGRAEGVSQKDYEKARDEFMSMCFAHKRKAKVLSKDIVKFLKEEHGSCITVKMEVIHAKIKKNKDNHSRCDYSGTEYDYGSIKPKKSATVKESLIATLKSSEKVIEKHLKENDAYAKHRKMVGIHEKLQKKDELFTERAKNVHNMEVHSIKDDKREETSIVLQLKGNNGKKYSFHTGSFPSTQSPNNSDSDSGIDIASSDGDNNGGNSGGITSALLDERRRLQQDASSTTGTWTKNQAQYQDDIMRRAISSSRRGDADSIQDSATNNPGETSLLAKPDPATQHQHTRGSFDDSAMGRWQQQSTTSNGSLHHIPSSPAPVQLHSSTPLWHQQYHPLWHQQYHHQHSSHLSSSSTASGSDSDDATQSSTSGNDSNAILHPASSTTLNHDARASYTDDYLVRVYNAHIHGNSDAPPHGFTWRGIADRLDYDYDEDVEHGKRILQQ